MECAPGKWGDIPVDAATVYVDASYPGADRDGSAARPWSTIGAAVVAAAPGALVAVAAGSYGEDVLVQAGKPVRLRGACTDQVQLVGTGNEVAALMVGADGAAIEGLTVRGAAAGIFVAGALDVAIDRVAVVDTAGRGVIVQSNLAASSLMLRDSLVENATDIGVYVSGSTATLERVVVRATQPLANLTFGRGISIQHDPSIAARAVVSVSGAVIEQNHDIGIFVAGSDATVIGSVIRDTLPRQSDQQRGVGITIQLDAPTGERAVALVQSSTIERNLSAGVAVDGSDATLEGVAVRSTAPAPSGGGIGRGIAIQDDPFVPARALVTIRSSAVRSSVDYGVFAMGSDVTIEATLVEDSQPRADGLVLGRGIGIEDDVVTGERGIATIRGSSVAASHDGGIAVIDSDATIDGTLVGGTEVRASDGGFGDGIFVAVFRPEGATLVVDHSVASDNARAGVVAFGARLELGHSALSCNAFDLEGEALQGTPFMLENGGGNGCGCPVPTGQCVAQSIGLTAPDLPEGP
jgi:hypothetical protein